MIDLVKHAENIRKKLAGISGVTAPEFSANTYFGVQPRDPVTPSNVIAERYARPEPTPATRQPYSLLQDNRTKGDVEFEAFNRRTSRSKGDTTPIVNRLAPDSPYNTNSLAAKVASRTAASDAAYAAMTARTTTLTPNVLASRATVMPVAGNQYGIQPGQMPSVADVPSLNVLERKQHLAQIGARR